MCYCVSRVLRQIFQSLKVIVDVILLLFFVVAFFALIGQFEFEIRITHCDSLISRTNCFSLSAAYYLFADADPTVSQNRVLFVFYKKCFRSILTLSVSHL